MKRSVLSWFLIVCVPAFMWAQSGESSTALAQETKLIGEDHSSDVRKAIERRGVGEKTKVTLRDKTELKGYISRIDPDSFQLTDKKSERVTTISFQDVERVRKPGMSAGAKAAIVGVTVGAILVVIAATLPKD
jgi:hypothetical protein